MEIRIQKNAQSHSGYCLASVPYFALRHPWCGSVTAATGFPEPGWGRVSRDRRL